MLSLTHSPLKQIVWKGKTYDVDLSFDTVLLFLQMQEDKNLDQFDKWTQANKLFFGKQELPIDPDFYVKSFELISKEITDTPYGSDFEESGEEKESVDMPRQFDYVKDAGAIYASFFYQYHIDLNKERGKMPWVVFKALFDGLNDNTYFKRIVEIRNRDPNEIQDVKAKAQLIELQNYYSVNGSKDERKQEEQVFNDPSLSNFFGQLTQDAKKKGGK